MVHSRGRKTKPETLEIRVLDSNLPDFVVTECAIVKAICMRCPVRLECLDWALETREPFGVWGGYSESERKQILLGKRKAS